MGGEIMYAKLHGASITGISGNITDIEVDIANGLPQIQIVGLPDSAIREAKERVRAAIKNSGFPFPNKRITINLAPADIKKEGAGYDLPLAVGILLAEQLVVPSITLNIEKILFIGELSLDGSLQPIQGTLASAIAAKKNQFQTMILPQQNMKEAMLIDGINVFGFSHLKEIVQFLQDGSMTEMELSAINHKNIREQIDAGNIDDFADIMGQQQVKRAITVAVAGMHNLLMIGPPGSGKSMIAKRIPHILPRLEWDEVIQVANIYSVAGYGLQLNQLYQRPFRQPHHSITTTGLIGGGASPKPGEISLAHRGVLFLDELTEYPKTVLESLRQPLEDGKVNINRVKTSVEYPADFLLVAAMNPCSCGYYGSNVPNHSCQCAAWEIQRYRSKISGPLLDRIDVQVEVPWVNIETLRNDQKSQTTKEMEEIISKAIQIQQERFKEEGIMFNSEMNSKQVKKYCKLDSDSEQVLIQSFNLLGFSGRSLDKILKVSRTIADINGSDTIRPLHIAEAINYRAIDKKQDIN